MNFEVTKTFSVEDYKKLDKKEDSFDNIGREEEGKY
jgi:hypothetical protein